MKEAFAQLIFGLIFGASGVDPNLLARDVATITNEPTVGRTNGEIQGSLLDRTMTELLETGTTIDQAPFVLLGRVWS